MGCLWGISLKDILRYWPFPSLSFHSRNDVSGFMPPHSSIYDILPHHRTKVMGQLITGWNLQNGELMWSFLPCNLIMSGIHYSDGKLTKMTMYCSEFVTSKKPSTKVDGIWYTNTTFSSPLTETFLRHTIHTVFHSLQEMLSPGCLCSPVFDKYLLLFLFFSFLTPLYYEIHFLHSDLFVPRCLWESSNKGKSLENGFSF